MKMNRLFITAVVILLALSMASGSAVSAPKPALLDKIIALEAAVANLTTANANLQAQVGSLQTGLAAAQAEIATLQGQLAGLENMAELGSFVSVIEDELSGMAGPHIIFEGANVHIRSGSGTTAENPLTGLGNLIIGYNEPPQVIFEPNLNRLGSHNLVVGSENCYGSYGGLVAGKGNVVHAPFASVSGGSGNRARGEYSSISGGNLNICTVGAAYSSISGGYNGRTDAIGSSISGGYLGWASGAYSSISGGEHLETPVANSWAAGYEYYP